MEYAALLARQRPRDKRAGLPNAACFAIALPASGGYLPDIGCGCSSGVEHNLAKVGVEGSNPFARSRFNPLKTIGCAIGGSLARRVISCALSRLAPTQAKVLAPPRKQTGGFVRAAHSVLRVARDSDRAVGRAACETAAAAAGRVIVHAPPATSRRSRG